jgi:hypothetical protein
MANMNKVQGPLITPSGVPFLSIDTPSVIGLALPTIESQATSKQYVDEHISTAAGPVGSLQFKGTDNQLRGTNSLIFSEDDATLYVNNNVSTMSGLTSNYISLSSGNAVADNSGSVYVFTGAAEGFRSGQVNIYTGEGQASGNIELYTAPCEQPGSIDIKPGNSTTDGANGNFTVTIGSSSSNLVYIWPTTTVAPMVGSVLFVSTVSASSPSTFIYLDWAGPI